MVDVVGCRVANDDEDLVGVARMWVGCLAADDDETPPCGSCKEGMY